MKTQMVFGEFFRLRREVLGLTLRGFCIKHDLDPGNTSRLEHGLLPPPQDHEQLEQYARFLELQPGSDAWYTFFDLAAAAKGRIPEELLEDPDVTAKLLVLFRVLREKRLTDEQLHDLLKRSPVDLGTMAPSFTISGRPRCQHLRSIWRLLLVAAGVSLVIAAVAFSLMRFHVPAAFTITDAVMCQGLDGEQRPVGIVSAFPEGTEHVQGCFSWTGATSHRQVIGRWHYTTQGIHILDVPVTVAEAVGTGIVSLQMPQGKALPAGSYRLDLMVQGKVAQTASFIVTAAQPSREAQR